MTSMRMGNRNRLRRMVCTSCEDHTKDVVVVGLRILESFDHQGSDPVSATVPIGSRVPGLASIVSLSEEVAFTQAREAIWVGEDIDLKLKLEHLTCRIYSWLY